MFFVISKIAGIVLFHPLNFLLFLGLLGLLLCLTRFVRIGLFVAVLAAVLLLVAAFSPLSALILRPLEDRFPQPPVNLPTPTGIVVLGGALDEDLGRARGQPTLTEAAARLTSGVALARRYPQARLVFTGGSANLDDAQSSDEAAGVRALWLALGIPADRMTFEDKSRNTYENATMTRAIVQPKPGERWLLVTSAAHMPRSIGIFRHIGWDMIAYPVDHRTFWRRARLQGDDRGARIAAPVGRRAARMGRSCRLPADGQNEHRVPGALSAQAFLPSARISSSRCRSASESGRAGSRVGA